VLEEEHLTSSEVVVLEAHLTSSAVAAREELRLPLVAEASQTASAEEAQRA